VNRTFCQTGKGGGKRSPIGGGRFKLGRDVHNRSAPAGTTCNGKGQGTRHILGKSALSAGGNNLGKGQGGDVYTSKGGAKGAAEQGPASSGENRGEESEVSKREKRERK